MLLTNPMINAVNAPVGAAWDELHAAEDAAAATSARVRLGDLAPDTIRRYGYVFSGGIHPRSRRRAGGA